MRVELACSRKLHAMPTRLVQPEGRWFMFTYLRKKSWIWCDCCGSFLLCRPTKAEKSLLLRRLNGICQEILVVLGADESWIAIFLQQKRVHMLRGNIKCKAWRCLEALLYLFHRLAINVDLTGRARLEKFSAQKKQKKSNNWSKKSQKILLVNFSCFSWNLRVWRTSHVVHGCPESDVFVWIFFA